MAKIVNKNLVRCRCIRRNWKEILLLVLFMYFMNTIIEKITNNLVADDALFEKSVQENKKIVFNNQGKNVSANSALNNYVHNNVLFFKTTGLLHGKVKVSDKKAEIQNRVIDRSLQKKINEFRLERFNQYQAKEKYRTGPGEGGEAIVLEGKTKQDAMILFKKEAFNIVVSDKISLERSVGDARRKECRNMTYERDLPTASVVIIFTNEAWSPLLRTVHSVVNRSPPHLLHEVILLDDFSDRSELGSKLEEYVRQTWPDDIVRIVRLKQRSGIMRSRTEGARVARGDVVVFLDSHCETSTMWLEPLLTRLKESPNSIVCPIIDVINDDTLEYSHYGGLQLGGFSWSLHFTWVNIPERELKRQKSPTDALRSATMAGGLLAMRRDYFFELGAYDEGMDVWGGENLEISFRVWMCGGKLEFIPCSRVGHIFRASHPYTFPGHKDTHGLNTLRMARVWMDDYIRFFYTYRPELRRKTEAEYGDLSARKNLRSKLKCHNFAWYLRNVFPEKFVLDEKVKGFGQLKNEANNLCLDMFSQDERKPLVYLGVYVCHHTSRVPMNQMFSLSDRGELRREDVCCETVKAGETVVLRPCTGTGNAQLWLHQSDGTMKNVESGLCLDTDGLKHSEYLKARACSAAGTQLWVWQVHSLQP